jgi:hypothetical protein
MKKLKVIVELIGNHGIIVEEDMIYIDLNHSPNNPPNPSISVAQAEMIRDICNKVLGVLK